MLVRFVQLIIIMQSTDVQCEGDQDSVRATMTICRVHRPRGQRRAQARVGQERLDVLAEEGTAR
jgi:hypothetical protein